MPSLVPFGPVVSEE